MNRDELIQRISEALDSPDGLEGDLELQRIFVRDAEASDLADEMARADAALRAWPEPGRSEEGWSALATRIEQRLGERLPAMGDPTAPPELADDGAAHRQKLDGKDGKDGKDAPTARIARDARDTQDGELAGAARAAPAAKPPPSPQPADEGERPRTSSGEFSLDLLTGKPGGGEAARVPDEDRFSFSELAAAPPRVGGGAPGFIDVSDAPPAKQERRASGWWVAGGLAAAAAVGLAVVAGLGTFAGEEERTVASAPAVQQATDTASGEGLGAPDVPASAEPEPEAVADEEEVASELPAEAEPTAAAASAEQRVAETEEPMRQATARRRSASASASPEPAYRRAARSPARPTRGAPAATSPREGTSESREDTSEQASGGASGTRASGAGGSASADDLPATPSREQVVEAMNAVQPMVESCAGERSGVVEVDIVAGSSGRIRSAVVRGYFAGTPEGSCVARAVRRARLPEFSQATFSFTYPFSI